MEVDTPEALLKEVHQGLAEMLPCGFTVDEVTFIWIDLNTHTQTYNEDKELQNFYKILSTNMDGTTEFLSTVEAYDFPIYATQWHPEKNPFEWTRTHYNHSPSAVEMSFYMAQFIVDQARKNFHRFESVEKEQDTLIYNYSPVYTGRTSIFEQIYYF